MKKKVLLAILMGVLLCTACGSSTASKEETETQTVESESTETVESTESEESIEESTEETETEAHTYAKEFNDYVEVEYEPDVYVAIEDDKPDYSGIYTDNYGTSIPYESCELVKQPDGTYYCDIGVYRAFSMESTAVYVADGQLEIQEDEHGNSGKIKIDGDTCYLTICYKDGETEEKEYVAMYSSYPDLKDYAGTYSYTTEDGRKILIGVHYDDHRVPHIDVFDEDEATSFRFYHWPPECGIYEIDGKLIAETDSMFTGPDDDFERYIFGYYGNHYMIIDNSGEKSKIYYKECRPYVMH